MRPPLRKMDLLHCERQKRICKICRIRQWIPVGEGAGVHPGFPPAPSWTAYHFNIFIANCLLPQVQERSPQPLYVIGAQAMSDLVNTPKNRGAILIACCIRP
jgi:hypothetical protein